MASNWLKLPKDLLKLILMTTKCPKTVLRTSLVCAQWKQLIDSEEMWKALLEASNDYVAALPKTPDGKTDYKRAYLYNTIAISNIKKRYCFVRLLMSTPPPERDSWRNRRTFKTLNSIAGDKYLVNLYSETDNGDDIMKEWICSTLLSVDPCSEHFSVSQQNAGTLVDRNKLITWFLSENNKVTFSNIINIDDGNQFKLNNQNCGDHTLSLLVERSSQPTKFVIFELASSSKAHLYSLKTGDLIKTFELTKEGSTAVFFSNDQLFCDFEDGEIGCYLLDPECDKLKPVIFFHQWDCIETKEDGYSSNSILEVWRDSVVITTAYNHMFIINVNRPHKYEMWPPNIRSSMLTKVALSDHLAALAVAQGIQLWKRPDNGDGELICSGHLDFGKSEVRRSLLCVDSGKVICRFEQDIVLVDFTKQELDKQVTAIIVQLKDRIWKYTQIYIGDMFHSAASILSVQPTELRGYLLPSQIHGARYVVLSASELTNKSLEDYLVGFSWEAVDQTPKNKWDYPKEPKPSTVNKPWAVVVLVQQQLKSGEWVFVTPEALSMNEQHLNSICDSVSTIFGVSEDT